MAQLTFTTNDDRTVRKVGNPYTAVAGTGATLAPSQADDYVVRDFDGATSYRVWNMLWAFDSSGLPDTATVTSAVLRLNCVDKTTADSLSVVMDWFVWDGTVNDWTNAANSNAHAGTAISAITLNADNDFALANLTNISKTGTTYIRAALSQLASDAAPTGLNYAGFAMIEDTVNPEGRLIVDYITATPTRIAPDAILSQTNLTGTVSAIQDDPDAETGVWLTAP